MDEIILFDGDSASLLDAKRQEWTDILGYLDEQAAGRKILAVLPYDDIYEALYAACMDHEDLEDENGRIQLTWYPDGNSLYLSYDCDNYANSVLLKILTEAGEIRWNEIAGDYYRWSELEYDSRLSENFDLSGLIV